MPEITTNLTDPWPDDLVPAIGVAAARLGGRLSLALFRRDGVDGTMSRWRLRPGVAWRAWRCWPTCRRPAAASLGRAWFSPAGAGIYLSIIVDARDLQPSLSLVTLAAGVAAAEAIGAATGLGIELKWPERSGHRPPVAQARRRILCESTGLAQGAALA